MPCLRHSSDTFIPASCSRSTPIICPSVNRLRFIVRPPPGLRTLLIPGGVFGAQVSIWGIYELIQSTLLPPDACGPNAILADNWEPNENPIMRSLQTPHGID